jgi:hypothetical protein
VQSAQVNRVTEDLMRRTQKNREILTRLVQREVKRQLGVLGMASRDEVARLQQRVRALEQEVERSAAKPATRAKTGSSGTTSKPTRSRSASSSGAAAKPSTRTRTGGASSRSTASSPGTRRTRSPKGSAGSGSPDTESGSGG